MAKEYSIKILGWKRYQNREVKTKSSWLRFQNDFIENPNFFDFSPDERVVWIYTLCCASKLNTEILQVPIQCSHQVLNRCTGIDEKSFHRTFEKLKKLRIVELRTTRGRYADDTLENVDDTLRNVTRRNGDETRRNVTETKDFSSERSVDRFQAAVGFESLLETFKEREVTTKVQTRWLAAFPDSEWVIGEINKALAWEASNPTRRKKRFAAFITRWLTKGWDHRKTSPSGQAINWDQVFGRESA